MFAVTVLFTLQPGSLTRFLPLMVQNARTSRRAEPGCLRFDVCTDPTASGAVFLYEVYTDRAAFDLHMDSAHFLEFDRTSAPMVVDKVVHTWAEVAT